MRVNDDDTDDADGGDVFGISPFSFVAAVAIIFVGDRGRR